MVVCDESFVPAQVANYCLLTGYLMEIHQLRYFCAVADTGSFSRAAEHSHVSQPSLSQQILKLEAELGARLFDRLGRSVRLTDVGKAFLPRALSVLRELEAARGDVVESQESVSGQSPSE